MQLTTPYAVQNGQRLLAAAVVPSDDRDTIALDVELRTAAGSDLVISRRRVVVRNGRSDRVSRAALPLGAAMEDALTVTQDVQPTPAGFTNAFNAWRAPGNKAARSNALLAAGLADGWIDSSLAGT